jgi:ATP-binding cassette subfamily B protein
MVKQKSATTKNTLRLYWQHARSYKLLLAGTLLLMPITVLAESILVPFYTAQALDKLAAGGAVLSDFYGIFAAVTACAIVSGIGWRVLVYWLWKFEDLTMRDLNETVFDYLMHQSQRFFTNRFAGSLVSQAGKFAGSFERLFDTVLWSFYILFLNYLFTVIILWQKVPTFTLIFMASSILFIALITKLKRKEGPYNEAVTAAETERTGQLADSITNITAVKSYSNEKQERKLFTLRNNAVVNKSLALRSIFIKHEFAGSAISKTVGVLSLVGAVLAVVQFKQPIGVVFLIMSYVSNILGRLWDIQFSFRSINRSLGDAAPMTQMLMEVPPEVIYDEQAPELHVQKGAVHFDAVDFGYPEQQASNLFSKFTLDVKPGEKIGLVGPSGGGKTTVTMLLLRFMDIQGGRILIDDQDISLVQQQSLRRVIAYVPQEPMMFHRSIADNIRYGRLGATDEDVIEAAKKANAHEFIEQLPQGYKTLVGERGTKLSGGQRQRVAIARAILSDAPLLVLDEATSALDSESEKLIQDALKKLMKGRTTLVIAHRLSTIQTMDRIIVLEQGHITEQGSHKELLAKDGHYAKLWNHQSGGFLED